MSTEKEALKFLKSKYVVIIINEDANNYFTTIF